MRDEIKRTVRHTVKTCSKTYSKTYGKGRGEEQDKAYGGELASSQSSNQSGNLSGNLSAKRILFFVKKGEIFLDEHRHILLALRQAGAEISIIAQKTSKPRTPKTPDSPTNSPNESPRDFPVSELDFSDHGINPLAELRAVRQALRVFRERRPHIVVAYTIKPILYSALASRLPKLSRLPNFSDLLSDFWALFLLRSFSFSSLLSLTYIVSRIKKDAEEEDLDEEDSIESFRHIAFFTGLGRAFMSRSIFHRALSVTICFLLRDATQLWVLNEHNRSVLRHRLPSHRAERVLLSSDMGVDLTRFAGKDKSKDKSKDKNESEPPPAIRFLFLSRLLHAKGVGEYLDAARLLQDKQDKRDTLARLEQNKQKQDRQKQDRQSSNKDSGENSNHIPRLEFLLAGDHATSDPDSFPLELIENAHKYGEIIWLEKDRAKNGKKKSGKILGVKREDVASLLETVDCIVLPSYTEGLPRVILEAAAMGVPAIVARYDGWQRVVAMPTNSNLPPNSDLPPAPPNEPYASDSPTEHLADKGSDIGIGNALTCACRDSADLARAMLYFSRLSAEARSSMGLAARDYAESHFSQEKACDFYLSSLSLAATEIDD